MDLRLLRYGLFAIVLGALAGCDNPTAKGNSGMVLEGKTMGTYWRASLAGVDDARQVELREKIQAQLDGDDRLMSTYKSVSAL